MADADDVLDFCKQALGEIGTRSTITSVMPPDSSPEAFYCNLFFNSTRDQLLRAAHWGFASRSDAGLLWKALPGTPENPTIPAGYTWSNRDPAPPWLYSYTMRGLDFPFGGIIQIRRIREQAQPSPDPLSSVPLFGGAVTGTNFNQLRCAPFELATDRYDRAGNRLAYMETVTDVAIVDRGTGYKSGDYITLTQSGALYGQPPVVQVQTVGHPGNVQGIEVNDGGTFLDWTTDPMTQLSTTGVGTGFTGTATLGPHYGLEKVILTNARNIVIDFTTSDLGVLEYDAGFNSAMMLALEGKLALALLGDKEMYKNKLSEANSMILEARIRDGNEGMTTWDTVPDWLQVRGVASMEPRDWFFPPYGPLFAV
jgi:hypothetical protein